MKDVRKICILTEEKNFTIEYSCRNSWGSIGLDRRTDQSYVEERHMETIYVQWKLQMDRHSAVSNYNASKYRIIDVTPAIADRLLTTIYNRVKIAAPVQFKVGDLVRANSSLIKVQVFDKGYMPNWSTEVFKIIKVQQTNAVTSGRFSRRVYCWRILRIRIP